MNNRKQNCESLKERKHENEFEKLGQRTESAGSHHSAPALLVERPQVPLAPGRRMAGSQSPMSRLSNQSSLRTL